jgi:hypothetical protein
MSASMRIVGKCLALGVVGLLLVSVYVLVPARAKAVAFPDGKRFALSIIDDTDLTTLERIRPIYDLLHKHRIRTTKTIWVFESNQASYPSNKGDTLRDPAYRSFILDLQAKGFEIALHGVRGGSSHRDDISRGLEEYKDILGAYPRMHINHAHNQDNLYWGRHRFSFAPYRLLGGLVFGRFAGQDPESEHFWGDLAHQHIRYVRQFTFPEINLLNVYPSIPYRLPDKPWVNYWFPTSNGANADHFVELLKRDNLDRLEREGGVSLVYAHMGAGSFSRNGRVDPRVAERLEDLASRNGWFAPASDILDYLKQQPAWSEQLTFRQTVRLETLFISNRLLYNAD